MAREEEASSSGGTGAESESTDEGRMEREDLLDDFWRALEDDLEVGDLEVGDLEDLDLEEDLDGEETSWAELDSEESSSTRKSSSDSMALCFLPKRREPLDFLGGVGVGEAMAETFFRETWRTGLEGGCSGGGVGVTGVGKAVGYESGIDTEVFRFLLKKEDDERNINCFFFEGMAAIFFLIIIIIILNYK